MKEIGKEIVEIAGKEYTLFLNRKGVVAWEKYAKKEAEIVKKISEDVQEIDISADETEITDKTNPFEGLEKFDEIEKNKEVLTLFYQKLYWIMLYENHKLSLEEAKKVYNEACEEYGEEQIIQLGTQILNDVNTNANQNNSELKNLKALRPTK